MFTGMKESRLRRAIRYTNVPVPPMLSEDMLDLIRRCCSEDPKDRPTMAEVKKECMEKKLVPLEETENYQALQGPTLEEVEEECRGK